METLLIKPPIAFLILLAVALGILGVSRLLAARGSHAPGKEKSYACGEDMEVNHGQPEYSQFFKFAFFFTIIHVVVLVVATDPSGLSLMSILYLVVTVLSLFMLFRR